MINIMIEYGFKYERCLDFSTPITMFVMAVLSIFETVGNLFTSFNYKRLLTCGLC